MLRKLLSTAIFTFCFAAMSIAQSGSVTGTVTDASSGETLPGVNVVVTEINQGASTDTEGNFTIRNIPEGTYTLKASFIGYKEYTQQIQIEAGEQLVQDITLSSSVVGLDEVVVSALGFEEQADEQGVSSSKVGGDDIASSGETDIVAGLAGKAAGVNITSTGGDPGAASRIVIRGANTITGSNSPLFVIDGVPVYNSTVGSGVAGVQQQSRLTDLNTEDIESVQVLKGPSASALWGSRASNGVVIIETKSGERTEGNKVNVSVKSEVSYDVINKNVDLQRSYGQGFGGSFIPGTPFSWGDKIADRPGGDDVEDLSNGNAYFGPDGQKHGLITQKNSKKTYDHAGEIFENGLKLDNTVAVSGGGDNGTFRLSVGNLSQDGIILSNSDLDRTTFNASAQRYWDKFSAKVTANYTNTSSNRVQQGSNISGLLLGAYRTSPDFNQRPHTVDYINPDGSITPDKHRGYRNPVASGQTPIYNNPLWTIENVINETKVRRFQGSTELQFDPTNWLNFTHRLGVDTYTDRRYSVFPTYDSSNPTGSLTEETLSEYQVNSDLIAKASHTLNEDFSGSLLVGWNMNHREFDNVGATSTDIILRGFNRDVSNYNSKNPFQSRSTVRTSALYGVLNVNAYDMFFFEATGRSESASTFGEDSDGTFFYPSASLAWQFTELDALSDNDILSFGKLRVSYGEAGTQPPVYETSTTFFQGAFTSSWGDGLNPAEYGGGFARSFEAGNPNLKVERTTEIEFGTDLRFFNDRITLNLTRYMTETTDAILGVDRAPSTGFSSQIANAASIENKGLEAELNIEVVRSQDFNWAVNGTWSKNVSEVTSLAGADEVGLAGFTSATSSALVGEEYGVFFGNAWARNSDGSLALDSNGFPTAAAEQKIIGNPNPDWRAGIRNTLTFKDLRFSFLVDIKQGGDVWNGTKGALSFFGIHGSQDWETTADQDLTAWDGSTITSGTTFRGYVEDFGAGPVAVTDVAHYSGPFSGFTGPAEPFIEDGGYVRLREVALSYSFNGQGLRDFTGLKSIDVSARGRNLLLFTDYTGIDPETNLTGPSNGFGLDYFNNPSTKSYIFSIRVNY
ncbi:SusC/RagA family TonB-linked outer membrane protein [Fodinibius saliphilus]|uniref:SusC/RagA family TonB-linked outer membrane protein n=1 Tax=Fodinibius saliphilus TaxID=1920650 RepID=UPI0011084EB7|nr:SusC/RagA family TonB-linked outer membrane protein [Fodinibius saliphilus]